MGSESGKDDHEVSSVQLKFGVDRILSKEPGPSELPTQVLGEPPAPINPPCSECVSSIYRCCSRTNFFQSRFFPPPCAVLHAPKPIRPFSNLSIEKEDRVAGLGKRKRSWSRAVFSNLQRKGLERRFQMQQYITKPDRRQLAATLGLTDAQVKVWFQNRRMKWRHTKEMKCHGNNNHVTTFMHQDTSQKLNTFGKEPVTETKLPSTLSFASSR